MEIPAVEVVFLLEQGLIVHVLAQTRQKSVELTYIRHLDRYIDTKLGTISPLYADLICPASYDIDITWGFECDFPFCLLCRMGQSKWNPYALFGQASRGTDRISWLDSGHRYQVRAEGMEKVVEWGFSRFFQVRTDIWKKSVDLGHKRVFQNETDALENKDIPEV